MPHSQASVIASILFPLVLLSGRAHGDDITQNAALGARVFAENCSRCHEAPDPASRDGREWRAISMHMRVISDISKEDQRNVLIFLRTSNTAAMTKQSGLPASH
jgi:mono/diheme cytochrome c family protein